MEHNVYIYHEIGDSKHDGWGFKSDADTPQDFIDSTDECQKGDVLNIHINSPGGSVFAAVAMTARIKQLRAKGITVNAYIDGVAASAASFLIMACENIYCYPSSMIMVHKPMVYAFGNADELLKQAETLEKIENESNMPLYMSKSRKDESEIKDMLAAETWMGADEMQEAFNIELVDEEIAVESINPEAFKAYKNTPKQLLALLVEAELAEEAQEEAEPDTEPQGWYYELLEKAIQSI